MFFYFFSLHDNKKNPSCVFSWWSRSVAQFQFTFCERKGWISGFKAVVMKWNVLKMVSTPVQHKTRSNDQTDTRLGFFLQSSVEVCENVVISFPLLCVWTQHANTFPVCWTKTHLWTWKLLSVRIYSHVTSFSVFSEQTGLFRPKRSTLQTNRAVKTNLSFGSLNLLKFIIFCYCLSWKITIRKSKCYFNHLYSKKLFYFPSNVSHSRKKKKLKTI